MQADDPIYKQLYKAYRCAEQQSALMQVTIQECQSLVESLGNLAEQLQCCRCAVADHEGTVLLLATHPDLAARLEAKLVESMEGVMRKLQGKLESIESGRTKLYYQYTHTLASYQKTNQEYGIDKATMRTATRPSIAEMLLWLGDMDRMYSAISANRQWMLDTLSYDRLADMQALPNRWKLSNTDKNFFRDILAHVSFFMAEYSGHS